MNLTDALIRRNASEQEALARHEYSVEGEKQKLLEQPGLMDKAVANMADVYSPTASTKKPKGEIYGVDTIEASKDKGDPTLGYGYRLREEYSNALASPQYRGVPAGTILHGLAKARMEEKQPDGTSLLEKGYQFNKVEGSRWFGGAKTKPLPGQDAWMQDKKMQEQQAVAKEPWISGKELVEDTAIGTALGTAIGFTGGGGAGAVSGALSGAATGAAVGGMAAGPVGALVGTGVGAIGGGLAGFFGGEATGAGVGALTGTVVGFGGSLIAQPLKKLVHTTDWYQGMISSNKLADKGKAMLADMAMYIPGSLAADKALIKGAGKAIDSIVGLKGMSELGEIGKGGGNVTGVKYGKDGTPILSPMLEGSASSINPANNFVSKEDAIKAVVPDAVEKLKPFVEPSLPIDQLLGRARRLWGPPSEEVLGGIKEDVSQGVRGKSPGVTEYKTSVPGEETSSLLMPTVGVKESSPVMTPGSLGSRRNILDEAIKNVRASDEIVKATEGLATARQSVIDNPAASNVLEVIKKKPGEIPKDVTSPLVDMHNELDEVSLKRAGLETITREDAIADPTLKKLDGVISQTIPKAYSEQSLITLAKEPADGPLRTELANHIAESNKVKLKPFSVEKDSTGVVDVATRVGDGADLTLADKTKAVESVEKSVKGGKAVTEEFFPDTKAVPTEVAKKQYYDEIGARDDAHRLEMMREEARSNVEADKRNEGIKEAATPEEIDREFKLLQKEETGNFRDWADGKRITLSDDAQSKKFKLITGMATMLGAVGVGALYSLLVPKEVDAGMWTSFAKEGAAVAGKAISKASEEALIKEGMMRGLIATPLEVGQKVLTPANRQVGLMFKPEEIANLVNSNLRPGKGDGVQYSVMSPYQAIESLLTSGEGKMMNPAVVKASFSTAATKNAEKAATVAKNIFADAEIETNASKVREAISPHVETYVDSLMEGELNSRIKQTESLLKEKIASKPDVNNPLAKEGEIKVYQESLAKLKESLTGVEGSIDKLQTTVIPVFKDLAEKYPSVRVALSLDDPQRVKYPWLPKLGRQREVAEGELRGMLDVYKGELVDRGTKVLDGFFPHSPNPDVAKIFEKKFADIAGGVPYHEFFHRNENSLPMLPDVVYSMMHYTNDIEQRIQNHDYWIRSGWEKVKNSQAVQSNPGLKKAMDQLYEGSKPYERTWGNVLASRYSEFEAVNKLFLAPSAGLKHIVKGLTDISTVGGKVFGSSIPDSLSYATKAALDREYGMNGSSIRTVLGKLGVKSEKLANSLRDNFMDATIMSGNMRKYAFDVGVDSQDQIFSTAANMWKGVQDVGSTWINMAELIDRGVSVSSALQMAAKKGMTVDQAMYGAYDLILKNNFLFNEFNPSWLNNPKIRAFLMFQATPAKIFERRLVMAQKSIAGIKQLSSEVQKVIKDPKQGWAKVFDDIKNVKAYMREGQSELKTNLFVDAIKNETDFFGTPVIQQLAKDVLTVGAFTIGGAQAGLALQDHFFHIPFLKQHEESGKMVLSTNPLLTASMEGYAAWKSRESSEDFLLLDVMHKWLGKYGPLPKTLEKATRLSENDIPEIYQKGGGSGYLKYLFSVPGRE